jgi:hypothetical protein
LDDLRIEGKINKMGLRERRRGFEPKAQHKTLEDLEVTAIK